MDSTGINVEQSRTSPDSPEHSSKRRSGEHRQSAEIRERILNAVLEVSVEHGYRGLTIARVSKASGMPSGSVYWHFTSKDHLLKSAMDLSFERHKDVVLTIGPTAGEGLDEYLDRIMSVMTSAEKPMEFWRIGVPLIADETAPEVETQMRFREIRSEVTELYTGWWQEFMPESIDAPEGYRPRDFAHLLLVIQDGFTMAMACGEPVQERVPAFKMAIRAIANIPAHSLSA